MRNACRILGLKQEGKTFHGRTRCRWENDIKVSFKEMGSEVVD